MQCATIVFVENQGVPAGSATPGGGAEREMYLRLALQAFESGSIDAYQYRQRVQAIDRATSVTEMAQALEGRGLPAGAGPSRPPMDAVDVALMRVSAARAYHPRKSKRYTALILVAIVFIVLIGLGVWLATKVHSTNPNSNVTPGAYISISTPGAPPSPLSPRR